MPLESEDKPKRTLPITLKLSKPVQLLDKEITELVFCRPLKTKDFLQFPMNGKQQMSDFVKIISQWTGTPSAALGLMDLDDIFVAVEVVTDFLPKSLTTGETQ